MSNRNADPIAMYDILTTAQERMFDAIELMKEYVERSGDDGFRRTILANTEIIAGGAHEWLSRDRNLDDVMNDLMEKARLENEER